MLICAHVPSPKPKLLPIHDVFAFNRVSAQAVKLDDPAASPATHANTASLLLNGKRGKVGPPVNAALGREPARVKSQLMRQARPPERTETKCATDSRMTNRLTHRDAMCFGLGRHMRLCHGRATHRCLRTLAICCPRAARDMRIATLTLGGKN